MFFKNIKNFFKRKFGSSLLIEDERKQYGKIEEDHVYNELLKFFPASEIYRNICLDHEKGIGEVDFLIIHRKHIFVIELKSWKGSVYEKNQKFYEETEFETKELKSPIKQLNKNIHLLKSQNPYLYFDNLLLFINTNSVSLEKDYPCFLNVNSMVNYIKSLPDSNNLESDITSFKSILVSYDTLYRKNNSLPCLIMEPDLVFKINNLVIYKKDLREIVVKHHLLSDDLTLILKNNKKYQLNIPYKVIRYIINDEVYKVNLAKIDYILVG